MQRGCYRLRLLKGVLSLLPGGYYLYNRQLRKFACFWGLLLFALGMSGWVLDGLSPVVHSFDHFLMGQLSIVFYLGYVLERVQAGDGDWGSVLASLVVPGSGQWVQGRYLPGLALAMSYYLLLELVVVASFFGHYLGPGLRVVLAVGLAAVYGIAAWAAWRGGRRAVPISRRGAWGYSLAIGAICALFLIPVELMHYALWCRLVTVADPALFSTVEELTAYFDLFIGMLIVGHAAYLLARFAADLVRRHGLGRWRQEARYICYVLIAALLAVPFSSHLLSYYCVLLTRDLHGFTRGYTWIRERLPYCPAVFSLSPRSLLVDYLTVDRHDRRDVPYVIAADQALPLPLRGWYDRLAENAYARSRELFGITPRERVTILFLAGQRARRRLGLEQFGARTFVPQAIVINTYTAPLLFHEMVHLFESCVRPGSYHDPEWEWFSEGLAVYYTSVTNINQTIATGETFGGPGYSAERVIGELVPFSGIPEAYRLATGIVAYLHEQYGRERVFAFLRQGDAAADFSATWQSYFGQSLPETIAAWQQWAGQDAGLARHFAGRKEYYLTLACEQFSASSLPPDFRNSWMVVHYFNTFPEIEEQLVRWNLRVAERDGADGFQYWRDNYIKLARSGRGRDIFEANLNNPRPELRELSQELLARYFRQ